MSRARGNEPQMPEPLAFFLTWSTYGTWLPGDDRGWIEHGCGWQLPDAVRKLEAEARMTEDACRLDGEQRDDVERQIAETCKIRGWELHAVNCRSNHAHVVVTADQAPRIVRNQLKAWCTRRLKELEMKRRQSRDETRSLFGSASNASTRTRRVSEGLRENWWAERGSQRFINDLESLEAAIFYVRDGQDKPREH
jgi:REP element-mobilizing transposase RayT